MIRDLDKELASAVSFAAAARTATANGTGVDLAGFNSALVLVSVGAWTDGSFTFSLEESDDNSSFTAVGASDKSGSFTAITSATGNNATQEVGYLGAKRYIRVVVTVTGSPATGLVFGANVVRGDPRTRPQ